jgi:hypothetical protein
VQAYDLGIYMFFSSIVLATLLLVQNAKVAEKLFQKHPALFALRIVELTAVVGLIFASLSLPRRPNVYHDGQLVDRMWTVSAFSRFQWMWPSAVLSLASKKNNLDLVDLPRPDQYTRSKEVSADWKRRNYKHQLYLSIIRTHGVGFAIQWILTLGTSVLNFAPQWVLLQLLRILERRVPGQTYGVDVWIWVLWLGVAIVSQAVSILYSKSSILGTRHV